MNSNISDYDYGFNGLVSIFTKYEIDHNDWVAEKLEKERGGISFMLPHAEGEIYLTWKDIYFVDVKFIKTQTDYKSEVMLGELEEIIQKLEQSRLNVVDGLKNMLLNAFGEEE